MDIVLYVFQCFKFLIDHSISKHSPSGIPYLHTSANLHNLHPAQVSASLLSPVNNSWHSSKLICSINSSHLALNSQSPVFQLSRPPFFSTWLSPHAFVSDDGCSMTVGFSEELVSPLMLWLTNLLSSSECRTILLAMWCQNNLCSAASVHRHIKLIDSSRPVAYWSTTIPGSCWSWK